MLVLVHLGESCTWACWTYGLLIIYLVYDGDGWFVYKVRVRFFFELAIDLLAAM